MRIDPVTGTHPLCGESIDVGHPPNPSGGFSYDAAGNITTDNFGQSYTYDAEGRIATEGSTTYKYDAEGQLIYENGSHGTQAFLRNSSGQTVSIYNPSGGNAPYSAMYAYIDGEKIGSWQPDVFHFTGQDSLGTKRYESGGYGDIASGTTPIVQASFTSLPFGDMLNSIGTDPTHFTGKERDIESGNDYFGARYYSSSTGRFMSPDPLGGHLEDPQTLNKYVYVRNNPLSLTDPTGLDFALGCDSSDHLHCQRNNDTGQYESGSYSKDSDGNLSFTTTQIGNNPDGSGGLIDKTTGTGAYTGTFDGKSVSLTDSTGNTNTGFWIQGSGQTQGITGGGALSSKFQFTFSDHGNGQSLNASFTYAGTLEEASSELEKAGYNFSAKDDLWNVREEFLHPFAHNYRSSGGPGSGVNSGHLLIYFPYYSVPISGSLHTGETNPWASPSAALQHLGHEQ